MTAREWLYGELITGSPQLTALVGDRVFAKKSMSSSEEEHPYIVYKMGYNANEDLAEDLDISRQFVQIFVHDYSDEHVGDYTRIDDVLLELKQLFRRRESAEHGVIDVKYLETSQDLNDLTLNTVMKYARFLMIIKEEA